MRYEWKKTSLEKLCVKIGSGATPRGGKEQYKDRGISLIRSQNILDFSFSFDGLAYIDEIQAEKLSNVQVCENDILLNITGDSVARTCMVSPTALPARVNQHVAIVRGNENLLDQSFLLYFLQKEKVHLLSLSSAGATRNALTKNMLEQLTVCHPTLPEQKAIAAVLSALDDKIELNNRINKNLEAQAQALFKSWFVDFEPFQDGEFVESELGLIPKRWTTSLLHKCCSLLSRGITPKYTDDSDQVVLNQKCIRNHQISLEPARFHIPKVRNDKWIQYGDVLVNSTGQGTLGRTAQWLKNEQNVTVDSHITIVRVNDNQFIHYIGQLIMSRELEIELMASGSTGQTELSRERLGNMQIVIPTLETLEHFSKVIEPMMKRVTLNIKESYCLAALRNTLLPKLMSGEIRVPLEV